MKKILQTWVIALVITAGTSGTGSAQQWINGVTITPLYPNSGDTIRFLADCSFSSGNCDPYLTGLSQNGNNIEAAALHCLGSLTFICSYTDTFIIPPLPAGNYNFIFHLESGFQTACTPGIVAGPTDTIPFVVTAATGIEEEHPSSLFSINPNPANGNFILNLKDQYQNEECTMELLGISGAVIEKYLINQNKTTINFDLPDGIYLCRLSNNPSVIQKVVVIK